MKLIPAPSSTGIVFRRTDNGAEIHASWENTVDSAGCTMLSDSAGRMVGTVEHLMAAFAGAAVDNLIVELDGPEVPIMDGSAAPFLFLIECAGIVEQDIPRQAIEVLKPVSIVDGEATVALYPDPEFSMSFEIDYDSPFIRQQKRTLTIDTSAFKTELSRARTFGFLHDVDRLRAVGLARGGSLENAIVVDGDHILNSEGLRYDDEFVRHKLLDAVGDLYLAGAPIIGRFQGVCSGHSHNRRLLAALFADDDAWSYTSSAAVPYAAAHARQGEQIVGRRVNIAVLDRSCIGILG